MKRWLVLILVAAGCGTNGNGDDGGTLPTDDASATPVDAAVSPLVDLKGQPPPPDLCCRPPSPDLAMPPSPPTTNVKVFVEPGAGATPVVNAIRGATTSVAMEMYYLGDSSVISALTSAASSGVSVRVILEQHPLGPSNSSSFSQLSSSKVKVQWASSQFTYTHQKSIVIDGKQLWAMTANMSGAGLGSNREYLIVDSDAADIAEAQALFEADWAKTPAVAHRLVVAPINARARIDSMIDSATRSLDIEWEELSDGDIAFHLQAKVRAGIALRIVVPSTITGTATQGTMSTLKGQGAQVRTLSSPNIHAKLVLVDGARGFIGSENATTSSLQNNRELGVLWDNAAVAGSVGAAFDSDFSSGTPF